MPAFADSARASTNERNMTIGAEGKGSVPFDKAAKLLESEGKIDARKTLSENAVALLESILCDMTYANIWTTVAYVLHVIKLDKAAADCLPQYAASLGLSSRSL